MRLSRILGLFGISVIMMLLVSCSGSSSGTINPPAQTVSGVAAAGTPLNGTVYLKETASTASERSAAVASDGSFSFDVSGLSAPFLLKAVGTANGKSYTLYSFASGTGVANINPLSHLAVAEANGSDDLATLYANPTSAAMLAIKSSLTPLIAKIQTVLQGSLTPFGASTSNFINDPFVANHQGLDLFFDLYAISVNNGGVTVTDKARNNSVNTNLSDFLTNTISFTPYTSFLNTGDVCVMPFGASVVTSGTIAFSAVVVGLADQQVNWSVVEANGGTITGAGSYIAPTLPGTYHVLGLSPNSHIGMKVPVTVTSPPQPSPTVSVLAGSATQGTPIDGTGASAVFGRLGSLAVDAGGNVFVEDQGYLRKITPTGLVTTLTLTDSTTGAVIVNPNITSITLDSVGNIYAVSGFAIEKITSAGVVNPLAGSATQGAADGVGTAASFGWIQGIVVDGSGNIFVRDNGANKIRKITPAGVVSTLAGSGATGSADGVGTAASFNLIGAISDGIAIDSGGNVYVVEWPNGDVRKITPAGMVSTLAGGSGRFGETDGAGNVASFSNPSAITVDKNANVYVADGGYVIRTISPSGMVSTLVTPGTPLSSIATDSSGNLYATTEGFSAEVLKIAFQ
jgi:sugar lactone lactonase YvrE